jgi:hypothetical protein
VQPKASLLNPNEPLSPLCRQRLLAAATLNTRRLRLPPLPLPWGRDIESWLSGQGQPLFVISDLERETVTTTSPTTSTHLSRGPFPHKRRAGCLGDGPAVL